MYRFAKRVAAVFVVPLLVLSTLLAGCSATRVEQAMEPVPLDGTKSADLDTAVAQIRDHTDFKPKVGIVLGSGLGGLTEKVKVEATIPYSDLDGFPVSSVSGHNGCYVFGYLGDVPVVLMDGRVHYYEGYDMKQVVLPACVMARLGVECVILTNAAGGLNQSFKPGDLMCITDQITSFVPSPLVGTNDDTLGERFPDMSMVYDEGLRKVLHDVAEEQGVTLVDGVYLQVRGPAFETPAESKLYASLGADAVGMSTATEATALHHMGVPLLGISCITNVATMDSSSPVTHEEVKEQADKSAEVFQALVLETVTRIAK